MDPLFPHNLTSSAVMLNPYTTPFIYAPTYYCLTPSEPMLSRSPDAVYYSTYSFPTTLQPTLTLIGDSAMVSIPGVIYSICNGGGAFCVPPPKPSQETYVTPITISPFNMLKTPDVVQLPRSADGEGARSKLTIRSLEFDEVNARGEKRTTVMIRNIPNKISRAELIRTLDGHCAAQNKAVEGSNVVSAYDFIYLPIDFKSRCNKGYAFVNFTTPAAAWRLYKSFMGRKWDVFSTSSKITHICYARIQGREALMTHLSGCMFECNTDDFLPAALSPPRDGSTTLPVPSVVGRRVGFHL